MSRIRTGCLTFLFMVGLFGGCGRTEVSRTGVSGDVTFAGEPVVFGTIQIVPDKSKGHTGPAASLDIVNGHFEGSGSGKGIVAGPHVLMVTAYDGMPPAPPADESQPASDLAGPKPLFVKYKIEANLKGGVEKIEIPESARGHGIVKR